jgi:DNA-binding transcriptional ArsR family regulator
MSDDIEKIRKELEEVRRLKEELRSEVEDVRREKEDVERRRESRDLRDEREELRKERDEARRTRRVVRPHPPPPVREPHIDRRKIDIDLTKVTDSLEDMMEGLGEQIEMSLKHVDNLRIPGIRLSTKSRKGRKASSREKRIERIPPEQVARVISPLGSEERLRILDFLKTGGKSFKELEEHTGKEGSSLTHHLNPLLEAGYVVKGEVRGTYYATVEGRLAYRLSQWLTSRVETQREKAGKKQSGGASNQEGEVTVDFEEESEVEDTEAEEDSSYSYQYEREDEEEESDASDDLDDLDWKE